MHVCAYYKHGLSSKKVFSGGSGILMNISESSVVVFVDQPLAIGDVTLGRVDQPDVVSHGVKVK